MKLKKKIVPFLLILPALSTIFLIIMYPIIYSIMLSFKKWILTKPWDKGFIGFANYSKAFSDPSFWVSIKNTIIWIFWLVILELILGMVSALLLDRKKPFINVIRGLVLLPWVFPSILTALMWVWLLDGNYGVINDILFKLGFIKDYIAWLARPDTALYGIIMAALWQGTPFFTIMILAALQTVPNELIESALIDGAGALQRFIYVKFPWIAPSVYITTLLRTIWIANYVEIIYIMTGGGPGESSQTLAVYTFKKAYISLDFGYASALSVILILFLLIPVFFYVKLLKRAGAGI